MRRFTRNSSGFGIAILGVLLSAWLVLLGLLDCHPRRARGSPCNDLWPLQPG